MDRWGRSQMWFHKVFCDVAGRRHLPGICRYPAKCTGHAVNQGGTADKCFVRPWQKVYFCQGRFFWDSFDGRYNVKGVFFFKGGYDTVFSKRWWRTQRLIILSILTANFPHDFGKPLVFPHPSRQRKWRISLTVPLSAQQSSSCLNSMERTRRNTSENMWRKWKWLYWPISGRSGLFLEFQ